MSRPLLLLTLLAAVLATGLMAYTLLSREDSGGRVGRDRPVRGEEWVAPEGGAPVEAGQGNEERGATTAPEAPSGVRGLVTGPEGRPVAGARVEEWPGQDVAVTTDADGLFVWAAPGPGPIAVLAEGFLPLVAPAPVEDGERYVLTPAACLTGRVVDETGAPVAGATLWLISPEHVLLDDPEPGRIVTSRSDGTFVFPGVPEGRFDLGARRHDFLVAFERDLAFPTGGILTRDLVLRRGREVRVSVANATENTRVFGAHPDLRGMLLPPGGIAVLADAFVGRAFSDYPVVSSEIFEIPPGDAPAETLLRGLPEGAADIEARDPARLTEEGVGTARGTRSAQVALELLDCVVVRLLARDLSSGVRLDPRAEYRRDSDGPWIAMESFDGHLRVPLDSRRSRVRFLLDGYQTLETEVPASLREPSPWRAREWSIAMVPVGEGETGTILLEFAPALSIGDRVGLVARDPEGNVAWTGHLEVEEEGPQRAGPMPTGSFRLSVLASGKIPVVLPNVAVRRGLEETYRVTVTEGGGLAMRVVDESGELLDEVHILLADSSGQQIDVHVLTMVSEGRGFVSINYLPSAASARADSGLAPGLYTLTAGREGYAPSRREFAIQGTEVAEVELTLRRRS